MGVSNAKLTAQPHSRVSDRFLWPLLNSGAPGRSPGLLASRSALPRGLYTRAVCAEFLSTGCALLACLRLSSPRAPSYLLSDNLVPLLSLPGIKGDFDRQLMCLLFLVMDITDIIKGKSESDEEKQHFIPFHP